MRQRKIPGWPEEPIEQRVRALRFHGGEDWKLCDYTDLRPGDIFKAVAPDGQDINPLTGELQADNVAVVLGEPQPACHRLQGYEIEVDLVGSLSDALARSPRAQPPSP